MDNEQIEKVSSTIELFGKAFEVSAATLGLLKIGGVATLGLASVFSSGIVPIVLTCVIGAATLTKYALEKYNNNHEPEHIKSMLPTALNNRKPEAENTNPLDITKLSNIDRNIIEQVGGTLKKYGVSRSYGQLVASPKQLFDEKGYKQTSPENSVT